MLKAAFEELTVERGETLNILGMMFTKATTGAKFKYLRRKLLGLKEDDE